MKKSNKFKRIPKMFPLVANMNVHVQFPINFLLVLILGTLATSNQLYWLTFVNGQPSIANDPNFNLDRSKDTDYWKTLAIKKISNFEELYSVRNMAIAKNVIIFIGDGMGISTITASRILKTQLPILQKLLNVDQRSSSKANLTELLKKLEQSEDGQLTFEQFESVALAKTYILDSQVGDSGACATALMCGVKANFETIGVSGQVKLNDCKATLNPGARVSSIIDWAQQQGKSTGFVTTTRVTHATPAAMYAHSASRYWECDDHQQKSPLSSDNSDEFSLESSIPSYCKDIARQLIEDEPGKNMNVIMGGGRRNFLPSTMNRSGRRQDGRNLIDAWIKDKQDRGLMGEYVQNRKQLSELNTDKVDYLLGIFTDNHMSHEVDREPEGAEPSLTEMALKALQVLKHNPNGFVLMVESGRIDHAHHNNNAYRALTDTLSLDQAVQLVLNNVNRSQTLLLVTADHSHVFTFGGFPSRGNLILSVDDQFRDKDGLPFTTLMYANGPGYKWPRENLSQINTAHRDYRQQSAVPKNWGTHSGEDVPLYATGPGSQIFSGVIDQTFIPYGISYATCTGPMEQYFCHNRKTILKEKDSSYDFIEADNTIYRNNYRLESSYSKFSSVVPNSIGENNDNLHGEEIRLKNLLRRKSSQHNRRRLQHLNTKNNIQRFSSSSSSIKSNWFCLWLWSIAIVLYR